MVYEVKCDNCGELIDFGGHDPDEELGPETKLPENAIRFDGSVYCENCVERFVQFGIGDVEDKVEFLMNQMKEVREELGLEKGQRL
ncbi:MAG: hypothetical protein ABEJ95_03760 [Candidatus Nanohalobium sp.]